MTSELRRAEPEPTAISEGDIDEAIAACDGDPRAAIKALLFAGQAFEEALEAVRRQASCGYIRARPLPRKRPVRSDG